MNYLKHLLDSKGAANLLGRALMIYRRFGLTRKKSRRALERILEITGKHGCTPTFFITADLLDHHRELLRKISENGTHVGLHGHHHIDHARMSGEVQSSEIARGLQKFKACNIPVSGFRGPFLRFNDETAKAVSNNGISWVSHSVMLFHENICLQAIDECSKARVLFENFYTQEFHEKQPSLPTWGPHCLEIPVSLPDDELPVDRLGIRDPLKLTKIWLDMLEFSRREGELSNFLFHPERMDFLAKPLDALLQKALACGDVWICSLDEIARWWQERASFSFEIRSPFPQALAQSVPGRASGVYEVTPHCSDRASLVLQHPGGKVEFLKLAENRTFSVHSEFRPVIAVSSGFCNEELHCFINEGFVVEHDADPSQCAFALDGTCAKDIRQLLGAVKKARGPLLRFWRWPDRFRSAMAVSADVDAITLWDFVRRARHFFRTPT